MKIEGCRPTTLEGVKRLAKQIRKVEGIQYSKALDRASNVIGLENFKHARSNLSISSFATTRDYVLLTIYWIDKKQGHRCGRETLRVALSRPLLETCPKHLLKYARGIGSLRMVAEDHFVGDDVADSQEYARDQLCTAERAIRFMEDTGLVPFTGRTKVPPELSSDKLPGMDHPTYWLDPINSEFILADEPYGDLSGEEWHLQGERLAWADRHGWRIEKTSWAGMYFPYSCDLYIGVKSRSGYDLEGLVRKINAMPPPSVSGNWSGDSSTSLDTFLSPLANTSQDARRARCKGMICPLPSKTSVPLNYKAGCSKRRPLGELGLDGHKLAGRTIKAVIASEHITDGVFSRLCSLRAELENWMYHEVDRRLLDGPDFYEIYYRSTEEDKALKRSWSTRADTVTAIRQVAEQLKVAYSDCAPLRQQLRRLEMSASIIENTKQGASGGRL